MSTEIHRSALMLYPADKMFSLVDDIEQYPRFMDGCVGAQVLRREGDVVEATLQLSKAGIRQSFTTRNIRQPPNKMRMELVEGPFDVFEGCWTFDVLRPDACKVSLDLRFSMKQGIAARAMAKLFDQVANNLVDAICKRAREVYND